MKVSIEMRGEMVLVRVPAIGLGNAGDLIHLVRPGQDFLGVKYDRLLDTQGVTGSSPVSPSDVSRCFTKTYDPSIKHFTATFALILIESV